MTNIPTPFMIAFRPPRRSGFHARPELESLKQWYFSRASGGICALQGAFGAGKSALLNELIDQMERQRAEAPHTVRPLFVYSFDLGISSHDCLRKLVRFVREDLRRWAGLDTVATASDVKLDRATLLEVLQSDLPCELTIVLDAAEKSKEELETLDGRLVSQEITDLLIESVRGNLEKVTWIVSTRYEPRAVVFQAGQHISTWGGASNLAISRYFSILVEGLSVEVCADIFSSDYQIKSPIEDLHRLAERCGRHALTVQLMGSFVKNFCDGDPSKVTHLDIFVGRDLAPTNASQRQSLEYYKAVRNLHREIVLAYRKAIKAKRSIALDLLEIVCLFRKGVTVIELFELFVKPSREIEIKGHKGEPAHLRSLTKADIFAELTWLSDLTLIHFADETASSIVALRPHLANMMNQYRREYVHRIASNYLVNSASYIDDVLGIIVRQKNIPAYARIETDALAQIPTGGCDRLVDIVYHNCSISNFELAFGVLQVIAALSINLGNSDLGIEAVEEFVGGRSLLSVSKHEPLTREMFISIIIQWANLTQNSGRLWEANAAYEKAAALGHHLPDKDRAQLKWMTRTEIGQNLLDLGDRRKALQLAQARQELAKSSANRVHWANAVHGTVAKIEVALGNLERVPRSLSDQYGYINDLLYGITVALIVETRIQLLNRSDLPIKFPGDFVMPTKFSWQDKSDSIVCFCASGRATEVLSIVGEDPIAFLRSFPGGERPRLMKWICKSLIDNQINLAEQADSSLSSPPAKNLPVEQFIDECMFVTRQRGLSIAYQEILNQRARVRMLQGQFRVARQDALSGLFGQLPADDMARTYEMPARSEIDEPKTNRGIFPQEKLHTPPLLAATHPDCNNVWEEMELRETLAMACFWDIAVAIGWHTFAKRTLTEEQQSLIQLGRQNLEKVIAMRKRFQEARPVEALPDTRIEPLEAILDGLKKHRLPELPPYLLRLVQQSHILTTTSDSEFYRIAPENIPLDLQVRLATRFLHYRQLIKASQELGEWDWRACYDWLRVSQTDRDGDNVSNAQKHFGAEIQIDYESWRKSLNRFDQDLLDARVTCSLDFGAARAAPSSVIRIAERELPRQDK